MAIKEYRKDYKTKVSENFKSNEFACKGKGCCSKILIDEKLVECVQKIRDHFGAPVTINSAYRCSKHNKSVGGASSSYHTKGMAADIVVKGIKPAEVAKYAESIGVLGIGLYETAKDGYFVHIDTRTSKSFWYGQAQAKRTTFGGENKVREWQKAAKADGFKITINGVWGSECESVAKKAICKKRLIGYKYKSLTKVVQKAVGVPADGKFGNNTKDFVKAYKKRQGLTADGVVGYDTWKQMLGVK
jgi:hypothetical protein